MILIGDVHGQYARLKHEIMFMGREENYIQVGDFGLGFDRGYDKKFLAQLNEIMEQKNCMFYAIRGNHDDPSYWERGSGYERVVLVPDNSLLTIEDQNIFFLGGGISIDRTQRTVGRSYWINEIVDADFDQIDRIDRVDMVITHVAPQGIFPVTFNQIVLDFAEVEKRHGLDLIDHLNKERELMGLVRDKLIPKGVKKWYYGHYHKSNNEYVDGVQYTCLKIMEYYKNS